MAIAVRGTAWYPFTTQLRHYGTTGFVPAADIAKDGNDVVVTLALPGVDIEKDVDVTVTEGKLAITGRRAEQRKTDKGGVFVREIRSGEFRREFTLPEGVTADRVEADYDRGLLKVRVREVVRPVAEPAKVKVTVRSLTAGEPTAAVTAGTSADAE